MADKWTIVAEMRKCADSYITILPSWLRKFATQVEAALSDAAPEGAGDGLMQGWGCATNDAAELVANGLDDPFARDRAIRVAEWLRANPPTRLATPTEGAAPEGECTCPSGDGSLRWPCPSHAASPPTASGDGMEYVDPDDVFLSQGTDDVPCLQVPGRILARFIPGSWGRAYALFSGNTTAALAAPTGVDDLPDAPELLRRLGSRWAAYGLTDDEQKARAFDMRMDLLLLREWTALAARVGGAGHG